MDENELVGQSAAMRDVRRLIDIAAPTKTTILIQGATGTGKELVARSIHKNSPRKGEMISINCSAIPAELLESELFGHEKGSFTGASNRKIGILEEANGGTVFLDEIHHLSMEAQAKILRAIQEKKIRRIGQNEEIKVNLDKITVKYGGRFYLAKDSRLRNDIFEESDKRIKEFRDFRKHKLKLKFNSCQSKRLDL